MAPIDPFSAEIVRLVRNMPDDAILALVKNQLGSGAGAAIATRAAKAVAAAGRGGRRGPKPAAAARPAAVAAPAAPSGNRPGRPAGGAAAGKRGPGRPPGSGAASSGRGPGRPAGTGRGPGRPPSAAASRPGPKPGPKPKAGRPAGGAGKRGGGRSSAGRQELLSTVERVVKGGNGLSASEIAKAAGVPQTRVTSALKELKLAKRIFQGGDRRFARYAGDSRAAESASVAARQNASGPLVKKGKRK